MPSLPHRFFHSIDVTTSLSKRGVVGRDGLRIFFILLFLAVLTGNLQAQPIAVSGRVLDAVTRQPLEYATIMHLSTRQGTVVGEEGSFVLRNLPKGKATIECRLFGYLPLQLSLTLTRDTVVTFLLQEQNLKLDEVTVTSSKQRLETTAYSIERTALDHSQVVNISDVTSLLPGGKSQGDLSLIDDPRIALRSMGTSEMGNASFGTAIEVDGQRLSNNAEMGETAGTSTRNVTTSDIEAVEVITGIPSVEYGDLSNGMVKVRTRRGKTPYMVDVTLKPHTKLAAISKGIALGTEGGILNVAYEWSQSVSSLTSPYTTYQRNGLSLRYTKQFFAQSDMPLDFHFDVKGNLGGYNSDADPDAFSEVYVRQRDYALRSQLRLQWQVGRPWLSTLELRGDLSLEDKQRRENTNCSSATAQPCLHTTEQGYHLITDMSPTGYWYELSYLDSKPQDFALHLKAHNVQNTTLRSSTLTTGTKAGLDYTASRNQGRGRYYDDPSLTPTWREARYDTLPMMHNLAGYLEEQFTLTLSQKSDLKGSFGLREDITQVAGSSYGTVSSLSPRGSLQFGWHPQRPLLKEVAIHAGMGKSVKLPSMQVLYPTISYVDWQTFASGTQANGQAFYAYYTQPSSARYNPDLRWQYSLQSELGLEARLGKTRLSLTYFHTETRHPYISTSVYTPFSYQVTSPITDQEFPIPNERRNYSVDPNTGLVTVKDASGLVADQELTASTVHRYATNTQWINGSPSVRQGIEWVVDFARIPSLRTDVRWDGSFYHYRGVETSLVASRPSDSQLQSDGQPYGYVGYYLGGSAVSNGSLQRQLNTNLTFTTHIPVVRLVLSLRLECTLYNYKSNLRETQSGTLTGRVLSDVADDGLSSKTSESYDGHYVAFYPEYYSTWEDPTALRPFYEDLVAARDNGNTSLYSDLMRLVKKSNTSYYFDADSLSPYFATNLNVTKEIGDHVQLSFYATNFWNNTARIRSSQTDRRTTLYNSGRIPAFYYGLSLKVKL